MLPDSNGTPTVSFSKLANYIANLPDDVRNFIQIAIRQPEEGGWTGTVSTTPGEIRARSILQEVFDVDVRRILEGRAG